MALRTRICELFGIEHPVVLAGMGGASTPRLVAAVSNAGGLGVLGAAACGPRQLRAWIEETRRLTDRPFGVDTLLPASVRRRSYERADGPSPRERMPDWQRFAREFMEREGLELPPPRELLREAGLDERDPEEPAVFTPEFFEAQMEVIVEERVPVYAAGLGNPGPWVERLHRVGTRVVSVVGTVRHARQVAEAGVDAIVAQGHDGGGHNAPIGTMALIPQVVDAAGGIPVLGAGGIADGRGVAAALTLGAEGAWVGSAFLATPEAGIREFQKKALVEAREEDTVISRAVTGKPARLIRNRWCDAVADSGLEPLPMPFQPMVAMPVLAAAHRAERGDIAPGFAGQGIGMIRGLRPAGEVLLDLVRGAERALAAASRAVVPD